MSSRLVVADAGPLNYLILIDCIEVLPKLFESVVVPFAVRDELLHSRTPQKVREWVSQPQPWLEIAAVQQCQPVRGLHRGETEALRLALERNADAVLMDDMDGRAAARQLGITAIFTVAVLELAAEKRLIDLRSSLSKLQATSFFISQAVLDSALERDLRRRNNEG